MSNTDFEFDLFLSHASEDDDWCERLALRLRGEGVRVWFDKWELLGGDRLTERVNEGIESSRQKMAVVWTPRYFAPNKEWTQAEQASRHHADLRGKKRLLLPVWREECEIPALLEDLLRIDFRDDDKFEHAVSELLDALLLPPAIRKSSPPVDRAGDDERRPNQPATKMRSGTQTPSATDVLGPLLDPVLLVLSFVFLGMLGFGGLLVHKGALGLGAACGIAGFAGAIWFLFVYGTRRIRGAPSSGQEFALIRNTTTLMDDHAQSAAERRLPFHR